MSLSRNDILLSIDAIDNTTEHSEMSVMESMINSYKKALLVLEQYNEDDIIDGSSFMVQESFFMESKDETEEDDKSEKKTVGSKVSAVINKIIDAIVGLFKMISEKTKAFFNKIKSSVKFNKLKQNEKEITNLSAEDEKKIDETLMGIAKAKLGVFYEKGKQQTKQLCDLLVDISKDIKVFEQDALEYIETEKKNINEKVKQIDSKATETFNEAKKQFSEDYKKLCVFLDETNATVKQKYREHRAVMHTRWYSQKFNEDDIVYFQFKIKNGTIRLPIRLDSIAYYVHDVTKTMTQLNDSLSKYGSSAPETDYNKLFSGISIMSNAILWFKPRLLFGVNWEPVSGISEKLEKYITAIDEFVKIGNEVSKELQDIKHRKLLSEVAHHPGEKVLSSKIKNSMILTDVTRILTRITSLQNIVLKIGQIVYKMTDVPKFALKAHADVIEIVEQLEDGSIVRRTMTDEEKKKYDEDLSAKLTKERQETYDK